MKKLLITAVWLVLGFAFIANAQELKKSDNTFKPGWFIGANGGLDMFMAEGNNFLNPNKPFVSPFKNNYSFLGRLAAGYNFTPVVGLRAMLGYSNFNWGTVPVSTVDGSFPSYKFSSENLTADLMINISNWVAGYNADRKLDFSAFAGLGGAYLNQNTALSPLSFLGRGGVEAAYKISPLLNINLGIEANLASDNYNDIAFTPLPVDVFPALTLGLTYRIPEKSDKKDQVTEPVIEPATVTPVQTAVKPDTIQPERPLVAKDTIKPIVTPVVPVAQPEVAVKPTHIAIREDIFFAINKSTITNATQQESVSKVVEYLKQNPNAKIIVSGYADKATGTGAVNKAVSKNRAVSVANTLINKHGISADRILVKWYGSDVQPYKEVVKNRVVIIKSEDAEGSTVTEQPTTTTEAQNSTPVTDISALKEDIFFPLDKADVNTAKQTDVIAKAAEYLKQHPEAKLVICGYANKNTGTEEYNKEISKKRTVNVANVLIQKYKINFNRITVKWYGGGVQPYLVPAMNQLVIIKAE